VSRGGGGGGVECQGGAGWLPALDAASDPDEEPVDGLAHARSAYQDIVESAAICSNGEGREGAPFQGRNAQHLKTTAAALEAAVAGRTRPMGLVPRLVRLADVGRRERSRQILLVGEQQERKVLRLR